MKKNKVYSDNIFPLNNLDPREFEELIYAIFNKRIIENDANIAQLYDNIQLMPGVAEQGKDCTLYKDGVISGVIQCKKYKTNLNDSQFFNEFLKFSLYRFINQADFSSSVEYHIATTTGYTQKAILAFNNINHKSIDTICDFESIINKLIQNNKSFNHLVFKNIKKDLINSISSIKIAANIKPIDINIWLNKYTSIGDNFFDLKKVIIPNKPIDYQAEITTFKEEYYKIVKSKLSEVNFIGLDLKKGRNTPTDISIEDIYVNPLFKKLERRKTEGTISENKILSYQNILKSDKNIVILGEAGAGKSLFVKDIILKIIKNKLNIKNIANCIPFRIELRKYNEERGRKSILEYILFILKTEYQIDSSIDNLTSLFTNNNFIVFFDGFDEIFDKKHKEAVKENIDSFSIKFSNCKCIVTSRFIGYHELSFNNEMYDEFSIQNLNNHQIKDLVTKFYKTQYKTIDKQELNTKNSIEQIENNVDDNLKQNPLILSLILILINNNIAIPDSKLEIYESCTKTLVDTIDAKEKELKFELPIKNKRAVLDFLGYWQYEQTTQNIPVEYDKAKTAIAQYLIKKKETADYEEAESKSETFLEYAEKRSIYFENNFTHKTFLEFFTADYLFINHITKASNEAKGKLQEIIKTYLPNPYWNIVFELLFSLIDNSQSDSELLDELISEEIKSNNIDVLYFFISHIFRIINVSDETVQNILNRTIKSCIDGKKLSSKRKDLRLSLEDDCIVSKISKLQSYNRVGTLLKESFNKIEESLTEEKKQINFYNLYYEIITSSQKDLMIIDIKYSDRCKELAKKDRLLFSNVYTNNDLIEVETVIVFGELFGKTSIFEPIDFTYITNLYRIDIYTIFLRKLIVKNNLKALEDSIETLISKKYTIEELITGTKNNMRLFQYRTESGLKQLISLYLNTNNTNVEKIITNLMQVDSDTKKVFKNISSQFDIKKNNKLRDINKIFK